MPVYIKLKCWICSELPSLTTSGGLHALFMVVYVHLYVKLHPSPPHQFMDILKTTLMGLER